MPRGRKFFVPVHGEYQHLVSHGRLAEECGVGTENVIRLENGQPLTILENGFRLEQPIPVDYTLVDGKGGWRCRRHCSQGKTHSWGGRGGSRLPWCWMSKQEMCLMDREIISRGFVFEAQIEPYSGRCRDFVLEEVALSTQPAKLRENIRISLRRFFKRVLERDPLVVAMVSSV